MAGYREPTFNLTCGIWRFSTWGGALPPPGAPDLTSDCQLRWGGNDGALSAAGTAPGSMLLLVPKGTDIRGSVGFGSATGQDDLVEVPISSGRYYQTFIVDDVAKGFDNEHRFAVLLQLDSPMPIP